MKYQGIYKIRNLLNGKVYVGQSYDIDTRFKDHKKPCKFKSNRPLYSAIQKYGLINFEFIVIEHIENNTKLDEREQYWMDFYKSYDRSFGYNLSPTSGGSTRGIKHTEEHERKIGVSGLGRVHSKEARLKMSNANKGKKLSEEHRFKLSENVKKRWENPEYRKYMSESHKGKPAWNKDLKMPKEFCEKISLVKKGKKLPSFTKEHKRKIGLAHKGKLVSVETRRKQSEVAKKRGADPEWRKNHSEKIKLNHKNRKIKEQDSKILLLPKEIVIDTINKDVVNI